MGKTPLPAVLDGNPSFTLLGGHRWFLDLRDVAGTYPDGGQRQELFAIRADGNITIQLTDNANLEPSWSGTGPHWSLDPNGTVVDGIVSWVALEWDSVGGTVVQAGIYEAAVDFDTDGNVTGVLAAPNPANGVSTSLS